MTIRPIGFNLIPLSAMAFLPDFDRLLGDVLFKKSTSISARNRTATQWQALVIVSQSLGLGVGLGSNLPSSSLFYVPSDLGVPGLLLFGYCPYVTFSLIGTSTQPKMPCATPRGYLRGSAWAFAATLLATVMAGSEVTTPEVWITWSLMAGVMAHACASMQQRTIALSSCVRRPFGFVGAARPV
jgi:hypothetical protein